VRGIHRTYGRPWLVFRPGEKRKAIRKYYSDGVDAVRQVRVLLPTTLSARAVFLAPLTSAASAGDFVKGALSIFAPGSKVVFLRVPKSSVISQGAIVRNSQEHIQMVKAQLLKARVSPTDKLVIIDFFNKLRTTRLISQACEEAGVLSPSLKDIASIHTFLNVYFGIEHTHGIHKANSGKVAVPTPRQVMLSKRKAFAIGAAFAENALKEK
jgi:hypothetical protein